MAPRPRWWGTLQESRRQACVAIDFYNRAGDKRSFYDFVVHMDLAWMNLLHADLTRAGNDLLYRDAKGKPIKGKDGEKRTWELRDCLKREFKDNDPIRVNVEFFIGLRDKIQHRFQDAFIVATAGYAHALVINYEAELVRRFGADHSLAHELRFPVFVQSLTPEGIEEQRKLRKGLPAAAKTYITKFESKLADEVREDGRFIYRVELVPVKGPRTDADLAITFTRADALTPDELDAMTADGKTGKVIVAEKSRSVLYGDEMLPRGCVEKIAAALPFEFNMWMFTRCYKAHGIQPKPGAPKEASDTTFCIYNPLYRNYVYTPAYVARCIKELSDRDEFRRIVGQEPRLKVTELATRGKTTKQPGANMTA